MIRLGLLGARGRMGTWVRELAKKDYAGKVTLACETNRGDGLEGLLNTDVVIDFSSAQASVELARLALAANSALPVFVVGSTGWSKDELQVMESLSKKTAVIVSSNFSTGVLLLRRIFERYSKELVKLGYQPQMVETHHVHKKDAPSGTAILLNQTIEKASGASVPTQSIRSGEFIGDHVVTFEGPADQLVFSHSAKDRSVFARGALDVAIRAFSDRGKLRSAGKILSIDHVLQDEN